MLIGLFIGACVLFACAYIFYGRFLARQVGLDDRRPTPAHTMQDGVDYVPTANAILFGHHFSSIAGAGPIVGPIVAAMAFGWAPALLWIVIGAILIGGVHDFMAMVISIRHAGRSIGQICKELVSPFTYYAFLSFILFTLLYVIIVFLDLTAASFAPVARAMADVPEAAAHSIAQGGAVATASLFYIVLAVLFGLTIYRLKLPIWLGTLIFVPLVFGGIWVGNVFPLTVDLIPSVLGSQKNFWNLGLLFYCLCASVLPVWILLQPRDYLSSYLLYACLLGGVIGLFAAGATGHAVVQYPAFIGLNDAQLGFLYPTLFVTIACGAVSGFHSIVASGTSAKQLNVERSARVIGYGSMLVEAVLALLALATVMVLAQKSGATPVKIFAAGIGSFMAALGVPHGPAETFGMLAVSTFLLTTLDTCTRLARFIVQEMFGLPSRLHVRILTTVGVLVLPALVVFREIAGPGGVMMPAWKAIWPAFGASNQLLAALALLIAYAWLKQAGKKTLYVAIPTAFMCITTITALLQLAWLNLVKAGSPFVGILSLGLALLASIVIANTLWVLHRPGRTGPSPAPGTPAAS